MLRARTRTAWIAADLLGAGAAALGFGRAAAGEEVADMKSACLATSYDRDQRDRLGQRKALGTSESRQTLKDVEAGKDATATSLAIRVLGRPDYEGARSKLNSIFEDASATSTDPASKEDTL